MDIFITVNSSVDEPKEHAEDGHSGLRGCEISGLTRWQGDEETFLPPLWY